jgi:hypothetical protein
MHTVLVIIDTVFSALSRFSTGLSELFTALAAQRLGLFGLAAVIVTSLLLAAGCSTWAIIERWRRSDYRARVQTVLRRSQFARHFRDVILDSLPEMVVVLRSKTHNPLSFGGGSVLLQQCLDGPDAKPLAVAIDDLLHYGSGFSLSVRMSGSRQVFVRGLRIGGGEALFLRAQDRVSGQVLLRPRTPQIVYQPTTLSAAPALGPALPDPIPDAPTLCMGGTIIVGETLVGEIIIATDGRLKHYNQAFARLWSLRADELGDQPLWTEIAAHCIARDGYDAIWDIVSYAATVADPERLNDWGSVRCGHGKRISLAMSRLSDGATRVTFTDSTLLSQTPTTTDTSSPDTDVLAA